jgi:hypothetical protein
VRRKYELRTLVCPRVSRAMENCPLGVTRNCPLLGAEEERVNEAGTNH